MTKYRKDFETLENKLKETIKHIQEEHAEDEQTSIILAFEVIEKFLEREGFLKSEIYKEMFKDLEEIYIYNPVNTYKVYRKYGVCN